MEFKNRYFIYLLFLTLFLLGFYGIHIIPENDVVKVDLTAAEEQYLQENSPVRVGVDREFAPYEFVGPRDQIRGLTIDYLHLLSIKTGVNFEFVPGNWVECVERLRQGEVDLLGNVTPTEERDKFMKYTRSKDLFDQTSSIYVLRHVVGVSELEDLEGRLVGAKKSTSVTDKIKQQAQVQLKEYSTSEKLLEALLAGEVDAVVDYDYPFQYALFKNNIENVKKIESIFHREPGTFAVRVENDVLLSIISKGMDSITDGEIESIRVKWLGGPELFSVASDESPVGYFIRHYYHYLVGVVLIALFLILWNLILRRQVERATKNLRASEAALKKSLEQKEILLKEVHHRVKNNLFTIISLLEMQRLRADEPRLEELIGHTVNRVHSMALIHQKIYSSEDLEELDFSEYLRELVTSLLESCEKPDQKIEVEYDLAPVALDIDRIIPCALIVNELVTNALNHGFANLERGILRLKYYRENGYYFIIIENNGHHLPDGFSLKNSSSLGLNLVNSLATEQLAGEIEIVENDFVSFKIKFPVVR